MNVNIKQDDTKNLLNLVYNIIKNIDPMYGLTRTTNLQQNAASEEDSILLPTSWMLSHKSNCQI